MARTQTDSVLGQHDADEPRTAARAVSPSGTAEPQVELIGESAPMRALARQIDRVARSDVTVAIFGESGTGKELVARAIHQRGPRAGGPFVAINCAAIPESLQEAELFGHERGSFTGATHARPGCFEQANHGTLLLDELGEMSLSTQTCLLRALQQRAIRRVGGSTEIPLDVRVVCATQRDLRAEVESGRFREDLYFRLVVFPIEVVPLRDRREDVAHLVDHALGVLEGGRRVRVRRDALDALEAYSWPGNVRELFNVVHRSILSCEGGEITAADLPGYVRQAPASAVVTPLAQIERAAIERALAACGQSVTKAAEMLGISRATLYRRVAQFRAEGGEAPPSSPRRPRVLLPGDAPKVQASTSRVRRPSASRRRDYRAQQHRPE
ncbi:sigma-54 interaction domain-containing protein [Sorangium sp. So ce854]|uniref:sigma-54 interaction domain-containing protein n=1 Tax=Sorangium sp. So ce854 TaxID=3133322 RepID=UPI003F627B79